MSTNRNFKINVIKELYARSGNRCAFPGCSNELILTDSTNLSEICHINGLNPDSARYDPDISSTEANSINNLILLCPYHHTLVDRSKKNFPAEVLINMKKEHEKNIAQRKEIEFNTPVDIDNLDFKKLRKLLANKYDLKISKKDIRKAINKIMIQNKNTRLVLLKIISFYAENENEINMRQILNEMDCDEYELSYQLQQLSELKYIYEDYYTGGMESFLENEDCSLTYVSDNYLYKLFNGNWTLTKKSYILLEIFNSFKSFNLFSNFLINKDISKLYRL